MIIDVTLNAADKILQRGLQSASKFLNTYSFQNSYIFRLVKIFETTLIPNTNHVQISSS